MVMVSAGRLLKTEAVCVQHIVAITRPLEVGGSIVELISIDMIYYCSASWLFQEC